MNAEHLLTHFDRIADAPDAIPRLRRFILDLAVRGKLVEQDPSEGTGSSLLAEIEHGQAARASSRKHKKTQKLDALSSSDVPFQVPENWALVRLGEALELVNGRAFKPSDWTQAGLPIVRIQNLNNPSAAFNRYDGDVKEKFLINNGDFLISWSGTPGTSFGAHIWAGGPAVLNQHIFKAILIGNAFEPRFLKLAINARLLELIEQAHGGVGLQHITKPKLEAVVLTLPPLAEQHRIVAKVDELMDLCDRLETARKKRETTRNRLAAASLIRLNAPDPDPAVFQNHAAFALDNLASLTARPDQIKALRQTILNLAVRGKLVEQNPNDEPASELLKRVATEKKRMVEAGEIRKRKTSEPTPPDSLAFELPSGWAAAKFSDVLTELQTGPFGSSLHQNDYEIGGTPVINPASMRDGKIVPVEKMAVGADTLERLATFKLRAGDIVMGRRGEMGRCAVVTEQEDGWLCGTGSLILRLSRCLYPEYLAMLIGSPYVREYLGGSAVGATMQNLNQSILLKMSIGLPPFAEQHRIVAKVDELMALCDRLEENLAKSEETRGQLTEVLLHEALEPDGNCQGLTD